jgi:hypothetical protein
MSKRLSWDQDDEWPEVRLTWAEVRYAAIVGIERNIDALRYEREPTYGSRPWDRWRGNIEGAGAEIATSKYFGFYWNGNFGDFGADDAGPLQVRWTSGEDGKRADLRLHERDNDRKAFVLVTGVAPVYTLRGWLFGIEGKNYDWWRDGAPKRPAFWAPQRVLRPISQLERLLKQRPELFEQKERK